MTQDELSPAEREARWQNARRWARQVNRALELGHQVFIYEGEGRNEIRWPIQIEADKIMGQIGFSSFAVFFRNDPEYDEGLYEEIDEWNRRHKITCYALVPVPLPELEGDLS